MCFPLHSYSSHHCHLLSRCPSVRGSKMQWFLQSTGAFWRSSGETSDAAPVRWQVLGCSEFKWPVWDCLGTGILSVNFKGSINPQWHLFLVHCSASPLWAPTAQQALGDLGAEGGSKTLQYQWMNHNESTCHCHCLRGYVTYRYVIKCCVSYFPHPILRSLNVLRRGGHIYLDDDPTWEGRKLQDLPACLCTLHNSIPYCTQLFPLLHSLFFCPSCFGDHWHGRCPLQSEHGGWSGSSGTSPDPFLPEVLFFEGSPPLKQANTASAADRKRPAEEWSPRHCICAILYPVSRRPGALHQF